MIYGKQSETFGFWAPTTERRFHARPNQTSLSQAQWDALPGMLVPVLERLGYGDEDLDLLRRGIWEEEVAIWSGYAHNTLSTLLGIVPLASVVLSGARFWTNRRARRRADRGLCPRCAYDLKHQMLAGCPECGWQRPES